MEKLKILPLLTILVLTGCGIIRVQPEDIPIAVPSGCIGDINHDGVVTLGEVQVVSVFKFSEIRPETVATEDAVVSYTEVLTATDADGDGVIGDVEFYKVIQNKTTNGCEHIR